MELHFVLGYHAPDDPPQPLRMKCSTQPEDNPVVAFIDPSLGRRWIAACRLDSDCVLLAESSLSEDATAAVRRARVLLFESEGQVSAYFQDPAGFSKAVVLFSHDNASELARAQQPHAADAAAPRG